MNTNKVKKIIKLSTTWCGPCRAFGSTFHRVSEMEEYKDIEFKEIDIEKDETGDYGSICAQNSDFWTGCDCLCYRD